MLFQHNPLSFPSTRCLQFGALALAVLFAAGCTKAPAGQASAATASAGAAEKAPGVAAKPASRPASRLAASHEFATLPDRGTLLDYHVRDVVHDGAYTWYPAGLSESHALNAMAKGHLRLTTPAGKPLDIQYDRHVEHASGDWTWIGHIAGHPDQQTILTFGAHAAFGTIGQPGGLPLRLTVRNGGSWVVETDPAKIALIDNAATRPQRPDFKRPPKSTGAGIQAAGAKAIASAAGTSAATTASTTTVDLLIGYTPGFATANNGNSGAVTRLNHLVDVANAAYVNSDVAAKVRLVGTMAVSYTDTTDNGDALEKLSGYDADTNSNITPDPAFNALRAARETYGADLVSLVRKYDDPTNGGCGIAWLIGGSQSGVATSDSPFGYSVVSDGTDAGSDGKTYYCLDETLAHEMGHNMGAAHDVETAKGDDGTLNSDDYGAYPYSFGYKTTSTNGNFYTIMAYGDTGQTIYRIFSDPRSTFCGGKACGTTTQADNARTLTQTIPVIASFRTAVSAEPAPDTDRYLLRRANPNGDRYGDLLLFNHATNRLENWFMNGTKRLAYNSLGLSGALSLVDTGDFNADRRVDLLFVDNAKHRLVMGLSTGARYAFTTLAYTYGSRQVPIGLADVNGNGTADILMRDTSTGRVTTWYMSGTKRTAYNAHDFSIGYNFVGAADFNGDRRQDLLWTDENGGLLLSLSTGTSFNSEQLAQRYSTSYRVAGVEEINGNGKADIIFTRKDNKVVAIWYMDGFTRTASNAHTTDPAYRLVGKGDLDGNRKGDLIFSNPSTRKIKVMFSSGTAVTSAVLGYVPKSGYRLMDVQ
ncbi:reprolysin-like metallopeptidase [Cognatiluteimonas telluris]|uniref:reprolysin-like metallopeptidase n=1 Tax=Cognatiluteimonas telluris TaxID=1104775 RepID=UPI00140BAE5F|nr:M12 family metallo-peptidase [Lysobacter telluris]